MIQEVLKNNIQFRESISDWQEAIQIAAKPLLEKKFINEEYIEAMINNVLDNGKYIIILPEVAMPHARHEYGALKTGISFMKTTSPVFFPGNEPVFLFFVLSADTNDGHLELLADLGEALMEAATVQLLKEATTEEQVLQVFAQQLDEN